MRLHCSTTRKWRLLGPPPTLVSVIAVVSFLFSSVFSGVWAVCSGRETAAIALISAIFELCLRRQHHALRLWPDFPANRELTG